MADDGVANDVDVADVKGDGRRKAVVVLVISGELRFRRECVKRANTFVVVLRGDAFINSIDCCCYGALVRGAAETAESGRSASFKEEEAMTVFVLHDLRRKN